MARQRRTGRGAETDQTDDEIEGELLNIASTIHPSEEMYYRLGYRLGFGNATLTNTWIRKREDFQKSMHDILIEWKTKQITGTNVRENLTQHLRQAGLDRTGEALPGHAGCDELPFWKIGERLNADQARMLGVKLGVDETKLQNLYDKVQRGLCTQEEMNFEMLHIWNARQTPDDDPQAQLSQILIRDFKISEDIVQEMFIERSLLSTGQKSELTPIQLHEIAERVDRTQHIPLVLRLDLRFNDLQLTKHHCGNRLVESVFELLRKWQNNLPPGTDQLLTMSNILVASGQDKLAYDIRNNAWGVVDGEKGRSMMFGSPNMKKIFCGRDLNVSANDPEQFKKMSSKLSRMFKECRQKMALPSQGAAACSVEEISKKSKRKYHQNLGKISRFLTRLRKAVTREDAYDLEGLTVGSIILHVRVYSEEGLKTLMEDVQSGYLGRRLAKVLMVQESDAPISDDAVLDITLEAEPILKQTSDKNISMFNHPSARQTFSKHRVGLILAAAITVILALVCRYVTGCGSSPCLHGGTCTDLWVGYSCRCTDSFGGRSCEIEYVMDTLTVEELQGLLRGEYERRLFNIRIRPWDSHDYVQLKNLFTAVNIYKKDKEGKPGTSAQRIHLSGSVNDIFQARIDGKLPMRILMVGKAGRGKTTAVAKMAYDWAYKLDDSPLKHVPLLFVLKMRHMDKRKNLTESIVLLLGKKYMKYETQLKDYIDSHEEDVVILFDGYDEYTGDIKGTDTKTDVNDILRYDSCKRCRVLVTTRPFRESDFFWDPVSDYIKMELEGYTYEHTMEFIYRFFNNSNSHKAHGLKQYIREDPIMADLLTTPLFCTMVCYMWDENLLRGRYTRTTFFDDIMDFLWTHAKSKKDINRMTNIERLNLDSLFTYVGQVAFYKLRRGMEADMLLFSYDDFNNNLTYRNISFQIGLLTTSTQPNEDKVFIEFFHKLAQEYSAGKYLSHTVNDSIDTLPKDITALKEVLLFASGSSDLFCEKFVGTLIHNSPMSYSVKDFSLQLISEATNECAEKLEWNLTSIFWGSQYFNRPSMTAVAGFGKLPETVKSRITDIYITAPTEKEFRELWKHLHSFTRLTSLEVTRLNTLSSSMQPLRRVTEFLTAFDSYSDVAVLSLLPNIETLRCKKIVEPKHFAEIWNKLATLTHLNYLDCYIPTVEQWPSELHPIPSVSVFKTGMKVPGDVRILSKLPNLKELIISINRPDYPSPFDDSESFRQLWNNLSSISQLHRLVIYTSPPQHVELNVIPSVRVLSMPIIGHQMGNSLMNILSKLPNTTEVDIDRMLVNSDGSTYELWNNLAALKHLHRLTLNMPLTFTYAKMKPLTSVTHFHLKSEEEIHPGDFINVVANLPNVQEIVLTNFLISEIIQSDDNTVRVSRISNPAGLDDIYSVAPPPSGGSKKIFSEMNMKDTEELLRKFWGILHSRSQLTRLTIRPLPKFVPHKLESFSQIKYFGTVVRNEKERISFLDVLPRFTAIQELNLGIGTSSDTKFNAEFHDIVFSTFVDSVMRHNLSLQRISLTFDADIHQEHSLLHATVSKFIKVMKSSTGIQTLNIINTHKCVFKDIELVNVVEAVRSIPSFFHLGISSTLSLNGEFYNYVLKNNQTKSAMKLSEQTIKKSYIKLTLDISGHPVITSVRPVLIQYFRRL